MELPLIIGFGGINSAGRSSAHHAYKRLIYDTLTPEQQSTTIQSLTSLMGPASEQQVLDNTLVRQLSPSWYQQHQYDVNKQIQIDQDTVRVRLSNRHIPEVVPENWKIIERQDSETVFEIQGKTNALIQSQLSMSTNAAACLPSGFDLASYYPSKNHPRALQMALFAISDCLGNSGLDWQQIQSVVPADRIAVYAGSSFGQFDNYGIGGLLKSFSQGKRPTAKQLPLGYSQSPADFANAYVLGNLGATGASLGACASFLYNLRQASEEIRSGRCDIAIAGASEAPLIPELINGFSVMNALCNDSSLRQLDGLQAGQALNFRTACRPFGNNAGFVMGESSQFFLLASPKMAAQLGARNFGAVADVFVNADGYKKSISSTGAGNYITLAKAASQLQSMLGASSLQESSMVFAHGTGTPLNRVTESYILNQVAKAFDITQWPVTAIKGQLGHSQGVAAADQLSATLGVWQHGWMPGIETTPAIAEDVHSSNLNILLKAQESTTDAALLNAKGFGGNNATGLILSPEVTEKAMKRVLGASGCVQWKKKQEASEEQAHNHDQQALAGNFDVRYLYNNQIITEEEVAIDQDSIKLPGYLEIRLDKSHGYGDIFDS